VSALAERLGPLRGQLPGRDAELPLAAPESEAALVELIQEASAGGLKVLPIGNGTRLGGVFGAPADLLVSTRAISGVVAYEPGDGTVTALAGTTMSDLAGAVAAGGHRLTPDVPRPREATLGGVIADGLSGGDRLRFGPTRHHVLGMRVLSSDGEITKTGGRLVKNVTGFELHRLYAGSGGSLCLILEASLRLFAAPAARACATFTCSSLEAALDIAERLSAPPLEPTAVYLSRKESSWSLIATLDGRSERVERERALVEERTQGAAWCEGADADALYTTVRDEAPRETEASALRISVRPSRVQQALHLLLRHSPNSAPYVHPLAGTVEVITDVDRALCVELRALGASVRVRGAADPGAASAGALEGRLKGAVDPHGIFCGEA